MRHVVKPTVVAAAPLLAMLALTACKKEPQTAAEVKSEIASMPKPKPGLYRLETKLIKLEVPGMPPAQQEQVRQLFAAQAGKQFCLTKAQSDKGYEEITKKLAQGQCTFTNFDLSGAKLDAKASCVVGKDMKAEVAMLGDLSAEASKVTTTVKQGGQTIVSEATTTRIGDCPAT